MPRRCKLSHIHFRFVPEHKCQYILVYTFIPTHKLIRGKIQMLNLFCVLVLFSALLEFMTAPNECLQRRVYNVTAMSFTPEELVDKLYKYVPDLHVSYNPDSRQHIGKYRTLLIIMLPIPYYCELQCFAINQMIIHLQ